MKIQKHMRVCLYCRNKI